MLQPKINTWKRNVVELFLILVIPIAIVAIGNSTVLIPYIGTFISSLIPFLTFFVYYFLGVFSGEFANKVSNSKRFLIACYLIIVMSFTFGTNYVIEYNIYPAIVARHYKEETKTSITYSQASDTLKNELIKKVGSNGVLAYAIFSERINLTNKSYGEYVANQFEDIDDLGGLITAILNIVIQTVPMLLKWLLRDQLHWVGDAGIIGLTFWYFFSLFLTYFGWSSTREIKDKNN